MVVNRWILESSGKQPANNLVDFTVTAAHSRDGPTPTATGRSSGCTMNIAAKCFIPAS